MSHSSTPPSATFNLYASENLLVFLWFELGSSELLLLFAKNPGVSCPGTETAFNFPKFSDCSLTFNQYSFNVNLSYPKKSIARNNALYVPINGLIWLASNSNSFLFWFINIQSGEISLILESLRII